MLDELFDRIDRLPGPERSRLYRALIAGAVERLKPQSNLFFLYDTELVATRGDISGVVRDTRDAAVADAVLSAGINVVVSARDDRENRRTEFRAYVKPATALSQLPPHEPMPAISNRRASS